MDSMAAFVRSYEAYDSMKTMLIKSPQLKIQYETQMISLVQGIEFLLLDGRRAVALLTHIMAEVTSMYPQSGSLHFYLGQKCFSLGLKSEALKMYECSLRLCPMQQTSAHSDRAYLAHELVSQWHFSMVNDRDRNEKFAKGIRCAMGRGHKEVLDIGSGTGILSAIALDCHPTPLTGPVRVHACEMNPLIVDVAKQVMGPYSSQQIKIIDKSSMDLRPGRDIPER